MFLYHLFQFPTKYTIYTTNIRFSVISDLTENILNETVRPVIKGYQMQKKVEILKGGTGKRTYIIWESQSKKSWFHFWKPLWGSHHPILFLQKRLSLLKFEGISFFPRKYFPFSICPWQQVDLTEPFWFTHFWSCKFSFPFTS